VDKGNGLGIQFSRSSDGGRTWTAIALKDSPGGGDQFSPAMKVDLDGNVYISFYHTPTKQATTAQVFLVSFSNAYLFSRQKPFRVCIGRRLREFAFTYQPITTAPIDESGENLGSAIVTNLGDRTAIAISSEDILMAWTDTRQKKEDVYVNILPVFSSKCQFTR
jgi:hypothetical protein